MRVSIASPLMLPSPFDRRVGIRIVTFEACSGFTHVTARQIAQPPKAAFVTRLQPCRLPGRTARQLPDQSTTLWAESSSASNPRLRGARSNPDLLLGGRTSASAVCRHWSGRLLRWSSCAILLRANIRLSAKWCSRRDTLLIGADGVPELHRQHKNSGNAKANN